ncbi:hypothetical protein POJ06DRAFT_3055 [Lipomyces tetrasporus]|uniref:Rad26-like helical repeats domain-containing protein n=1 Tax=Lipomyces tetrasporus TaxID=54092 RepID=A0AAD7VUV4_9ASCO|nr:uncharacterized protein POJ06DRAFT_3055 [Lipomyces tetrasporus]KAJ8103537.1 hypothetical protein POJ06DRAFT_3055 [Lipomyces tetrasporus]
MVQPKMAFSVYSDNDNTKANCTSKTGTADDEDYEFYDDIDEQELQLLEENAYKLSQAVSTRSKPESVRVPVNAASSQVEDFFAEEDDGDELAMDDIMRQHAELNAWSHQPGLQRRGESTNEVVALVTQLEELRKHNTELQRARDEALTSLQTARGEISIIRSHMININTVHDQTIAHLRSVQETEKERHDTEVAELRREIDRLQAERAFMERDLKDVMDKLRERAVQREPQSAASEFKTSPSPRKPKRADRSSGLRDGFDVPISPTKIGRKRRRPDSADIEDNRNVLRETTNRESMSSRDSSTGSALFGHGSESMSTTPKEIIQEKEIVTDEVRIPVEDKYEFVTKLYSCQLESNGGNLFDVLSQRSVELKDNDGCTKYSGSISAAITSIINTENRTLESLVESLILRTMELWQSQVIHSTTMTTIDPLLSVLKFIVTYNPNIISLTMLQGVVVACQETFVRLESRAILHSTDWQAKTQLAVLSLFESVVCVLDDRQGSYSKHSNRIMGVWQSVSIEFVLRMLANRHVTPRLSIRFHQSTSRILAASVLPGSFGPVLQAQDDQSSAESHIVDNLTRLLIDDPVGFSVIRVEMAENTQHPDYDEYEYELEIVSSRLQIVNTLRAIACTRHGQSLMADHAKVTARLICCVSQQLDRVYENGFVHNNTERTDLISLVVQLLHRMHFGSDTPADDCRPVSSIADNPNILNPYGAKYELVAGLTRVAFGEGMVYHDAFDDTTVDCARNLLQIGRTIHETNLLYASVNAE